MLPLLRFLLSAAIVAGLIRSTALAEPALHTYALVIGSNGGGPGQGRLAFAERDASRVAELLRELGRTPPENIEQLAAPTAGQIEQVLARLRARLALHANAHERAQLLFYYSGHARARALSLGAEEFSLDALRSALLALPSTLTIVVLDACQSGAFSGVKSAMPAADFSLSSVHGLHSSGVAVMASSTASELSQESHELESSYFTHHLLVALRGAGDIDRNGRVSLDEAYRYAYEQTLSDTARTQVGSQHATLETELTGRGDVPLSYPVDADAQLALPPGLEGRVLVQKEKRGAVMAELMKAPGAQVLLALPSGRYEVLVRRDQKAKSCSVSLTRDAVQSLTLEACADVTLTVEASKHAERPPTFWDRQPAESWFLEVGIAIDQRREDAYTETLRAVGYEKAFDPLGSRAGQLLNPDAALGIGLGKYAQLLARAWKMDSRVYERGKLFANPGAYSRVEEFSWRTRAVALGSRLRLPVARHWFALFAELDVGIGFTRSDFDYYPDEQMGEGVAQRTYVERQRGPVVRGTGGFTVGLSKHFGAYFAAGWTYAPVLENRFGETHDSGGYTFSHGLRLNGAKGWW